jgi:hypothetical protein
MEFETLLKQIKDARQNPDTNQAYLQELEGSFIRLILQAEDRLIM